MKPLTTLAAESRFIISRNDAMGDVVLTLPVAALIKQYYPNSEIIFLARNYVKDIVESCPSIDHFLSWDELDKMEFPDAVQKLADLKADVILHIKPDPKIAKLAKKAKIKTRIGTSRRWYHALTCNKRVAFSRAKSVVHEAQLNLKLLPPLFIPDNFSLEQLVPLLNVHPKNPLSDKIKKLINPARFNLVIHPLSNGHGREWPLNYYRELIHALPQDKFNIIITGSANERERLEKPLLDPCPQAMCCAGELNVAELMTLLKHADGILVGSTGPLHLAAAIGIRVLGLFPPKKVMNAHRWGPVGAKAEYLMLNKNCNDCNLKLADQCPCMNAISVIDVKNKIMQWISPS